MGKNKPSKNQKTKKTEKKFKKDDPKKAFSKFNKGNGPKNNLKSPTKAASDEQVKSNRSKPSSLQTKSIVAKDASLTNQKGLSSLQMKFAKKLEGSRFRSINENLYTTRGDDAFLKFQKDPDSFEIYHQGFREQASQWSVNPLDGIINWIKRHHNKAVVADMGCGDARMAEEVPKTVKVHSFDLVSQNPRVVACDVANVPLPDESVDIVVFCLALMGVNVGDFIEEAHRILKPKGIIRIAEVRSRFDDKGTGIKKFTSFLKRAGFDIEPHDKAALSKMFFELEGRKTDRCSVIDDSYTVKPCLYKRR